VAASIRLYISYSFQDESQNIINAFFWQSLELINNADRFG
jgi:hypothetical protein